MKPAFIVGQYKSGSTWLLHLLSLHPDIRGVNETHVFQAFDPRLSIADWVDRMFTKVPWAEGGFDNRRRYLVRRFLLELGHRGIYGLPRSARPLNLHDVPPRRARQLARELRGLTDPADLCRTFLEALKDEAGLATYLLEKTPEHIRHVDDIRAVFPDAKLLSIYRDGRDVVVSDQHFIKDVLNLRKGFGGSCKRWRLETRLLLEAREKHGVHCVSYEGLQADGDRVVTDILNYLQLPHSPDMVREMLERSSFEFMTGRKRGIEKVGGFNRKGVVGDWRSHFTLEDAETFQRICGDDLVALGYEANSGWVASHQPTRVGDTFESGREQLHGR